MTLLGGAAATWPLAARAQQVDRVRRIGVLLNLNSGDLELKARIKALLEGLQEKGWIDGRNVRIDYRWAIHPHIIADDTKRYPLAPLGGHQSDWSRTRPVTTAQMVAAMDKAGVAKAAIVQASTCYGHDNSYVADAIAAHPDRFTGVFSVDVLAADAPEKMRLAIS